MGSTCACAAPGGSSPCSPSRSLGEGFVWTKTLRGRVLGAADGAAETLQDRKAEGRPRGNA